TIAIRGAGRADEVPGDTGDARVQQQRDDEPGDGGSHRPADCRGPGLVGQFWRGGPPARVIDGARIGGGSFVEILSYCQSHVKVALRRGPEVTCTEGVDPDVAVVLLVEQVVDADKRRD